ncbi:MAG: Imm1 family immunity protein [Streptosporangiaceae bacterium]
MMMLSWDERGSLAPVSSKEELDRLLDDVSGQAADGGSPCMATMLDADDPEGPALSIGCGASVSVAVWQLPSAPTSLVSHGEAEREPLVFSYCGEDATYDPPAAIPNAQAREAMRAFYATGTRPDTFAWREP